MGEEYVLTAQAAKKELRKYARPQVVSIMTRFFKTGKGQYGAGDKFIGVKVPNTRKVALKFRELSLAHCRLLLRSKIHEDRLLALIILSDKFKRSEEPERKQIYDLYLKNLKYVNNWDLVDSSAPYIVGAYLFDRNRSVLYKMARSKDLWTKRVSILATQHFIRNNDFEDTLKIAKLLLKDDHDLIHKAVGWMLREVGNRDAAVEHKFLRKHCRVMPRTMLRYAIEKFPISQRKAYLAGKV